MTTSVRRDSSAAVASGAVEVRLDPAPLRLGSGDFFGELALEYRAARGIPLLLRAAVDLRKAGGIFLGFGARTLAHVVFGRNGMVHAVLPGGGFRLVAEVPATVGFRA